MLCDNTKVAVRETRGGSYVQNNYVKVIGLVFGALSVWEEKIILGTSMATCCDLPEALKKILKIIVK